MSLITSLLSGKFGELKKLRTERRLNKFIKDFGGTQMLADWIWEILKRDENTKEVIKNRLERINFPPKTSKQTL